MYISAFMLSLSLLKSIIISKATQILLTIDTNQKIYFELWVTLINICSLNIFQLFLSVSSDNYFNHIKNNCKYGKIICENNRVNCSL